MAKIHFIGPDGAERVVEAKSGLTLMESAVHNNVPGIDAECGGACACATCHLYIDESWRASVGEPNATEAEMLEFAVHRGPGSRLSCQITVTDALDGLAVRVPVSQH